MIGIGTYKLSVDVYKIVKEGLKIGYRIIDTASLYKNEISVLDAIEDSEIDRKEITIISKIHLFSPENILEKSKLYSSRPKIKYLDYLLLHYPTPTYVKDWEFLFNNKPFNIINVGVSNYGITHIQSLCSTPAMNQIELSPFCTRKELVEFLKQQGIKIVAHSSLTKGKLLNNQVVIKLAQKYNCTNASILLNWGVSKGFIVLPRTADEKHLRENIKIIKIEPRDIDELDSLDQNFLTHQQHKC